MMYISKVSFAAFIITASSLTGCEKKDEVSAANAKSPEPPKPAPAAAAPAAAAPKPGLPVKAEPVKVAEVQSDVTAVGTLSAADSVVIRPEIAGRVVTL